MMFSLSFSSQSRKFLGNCDKKLKERLLSRVRSLGVEPVPHGAVHVVGEGRTFRIRVGDYRVLYEILWKRSEIVVAVIDKRSSAYRKR